MEFLIVPGLTSHIWKPKIKISDCSSEYLKNCTVDYSLLENPFSSKTEAYDEEKEKKIWQGLGIVKATDEGSRNQLACENPFYMNSVPGLQSKREQKRIRREECKRKLSNWYNLPRPDLTQEDHDDLEVIRLRRALSTDVHVRRSDSKATYFQRGVVVDDPGSFYERVPKKQRGRTIVDELLVNAEIMKNHRKRYARIAREMANKRAALRRREQQRVKRLKAKGGKQPTTVIVPE